jgi:hypothetical protein
MPLPGSRPAAGQSPTLLVGSCPAAAGNVAFILAHAGGQGSPTYGPARRSKVLGVLPGRSTEGPAAGPAAWAGVHPRGFREVSGSVDTALMPGVLCDGPDGSLSGAHTKKRHCPWREIAPSRMLPSPHSDIGASRPPEGPYTCGK